MRLVLTLLINLAEGGCKFLLGNIVSGFRICLRWCWFVESRRPRALVQGIGALGRVFLFCLFSVAVCV